jgi:hypothetical protein
MRYLKGTIDYGLKYSLDREMSLQVFTNSDWAGNVADHKSTSRCCFSMGSAMISWLNRKQTIVVLRTAEGEYIAACLASNKVVWIWKLLHIIFIIPMTVNDVNLSVAFRGVSGLSS